MKNDRKDIIGQIYVDPVCWMKVVPSGGTETVTYKMRTYYFCTAACRRAFEANLAAIKSTRQMALKALEIGK